MTNCGIGILDHETTENRNTWTSIFWEGSKVKRKFTLFYLRQNINWHTKTKMLGRRGKVSWIFLHVVGGGWIFEYSFKTAYIGAHREEVLRDAERPQVSNWHSQCHKSLINYFGLVIWKT